MVRKYFHWTSTLCWPRNILCSGFVRSSIFPPQVNWVYTITHARNHDIGRSLRTAWTAYVIWWAYARSIQLGRPPDSLTPRLIRSLAMAIRGLRTVTILDICQSIDQDVNRERPDPQDQTSTGMRVLEGNHHPSSAPPCHRT